MRVGGVGYYPTSGSPFVHMDTGGVRMWPRMTYDQLARVFPNGKTLYVPSDGRPLPGYDAALAAYKARRVGDTSVMLADNGASEVDDSRAAADAKKVIVLTPRSASVDIPLPRRAPVRVNPAVDAPADRAHRLRGGAAIAFYPVDGDEFPDLRDALAGNVAPGVNLQARHQFALGVSYGF